MHMIRILTCLVLAGVVLSLAAGCDDSMKFWADRPWKTKVRVDGGKIQHEWRAALHNDRKQTPELRRELARWWSNERERWPVYETVDSRDQVEGDIRSAQHLSGGAFVR